MTETVTVPRAEYEHLCALEEEMADFEASAAVEVQFVSGKEELVSASLADRLVDGAPPLRESGASIAVSHNPPLPGPPG